MHNVVKGTKLHNHDPRWLRFHQRFLCVKFSLRKRNAFAFAVESLFVTFLALQRRMRRRGGGQHPAMLDTVV